MSCNGLSEFRVISSLSALLSFKQEGVIRAIGDDCAVLSLGEEALGQHLLWTIDTMAEGVHFDLGWSSLADVGWKLIASSVSDVGAMGGRVWAATISCQVPKYMTPSDLEHLYTGINEASNYFRVGVVGGDTVAGSGFTLSSSVLGRCESKPIYRSGAQVGDDVWVSGAVGGAWAGVVLLRQIDLGSLVASNLSDDEVSAIGRHRRPLPPLSFGYQLGRFGLVNSMIDVSDGLLQDVAHIAEHSSVAIEIRQDDVPMHGAVSENNVIQAMAGGDDYEVAFTAPSENRLAIDELAASCGLANAKIIGDVVQSTHTVKGVSLRTSDGRVLVVGRDVKGGYVHTLNAK